MIPAPFWGITQRGVVTANGRSLKDPTGRPETSVMNYHSTPRNISERSKIQVYHHHRYNYLLDPGSYPMRTVVSSLGVNRQGREAGHSPSSASYESGEIHFTRPHIICLHGVDKDSFIIIIIIIIIPPPPPAARSKAWVCDRSLAGIAGSNRAGDMDACLVNVVCCQRSLRRADNSCRGVLPIVWCVSV